MSNEDELLDRIAQLEEIVGLSAAVPVTAKLRKRGLHPQETRVLCVLLRRPFLPLDSAYDLLYGDLPEQDRPTGDSTIRTAIKRLRKALDGIGVEIQTCYGEGYYIDQESKQKLLRVWPELAEHTQKKAA